MPKSQYNIPYVIVTQNMMMNAARSCVQTMKTLSEKNESEFSSWHVPFYILATTALELFPKIYLSRTKESGEPIPQIIKEFKSFGHNLEVLYSKKGVGNDFLSRASISKVVKVMDKEQFIYRFDFYRNNKADTPIQVYDMESLRYGFMAGQKSNAGIVAYQCNELLDLCRAVEEAST